MEKLIAFLVGVLAAWVALIPYAFAAYVLGDPVNSTTAVVTTYSVANAACPRTDYQSLGAAGADCAALASSYYGMVITFCGTGSHAAGSIDIEINGSACGYAPNSSYYNSSTVNHCPSGYTYQSGANNCKVVSGVGCPSGYAASLKGNGTCSDAKPAGSCNPNSVDAAYTPYNDSTIGPPNLCVEGCGYAFTSASNQKAVDGVQVWGGIAQGTGQACQAGAVAARSTSENQALGGTQPTEINCPSGQVPQTINGVTSCFAAAGTAPAKNVNTSISVSGGTVSTNQTINSDTGSGVGTVNRSQTGNGSPTIVVTGNSAPAKTTFCQDNPNSQLCTGTIATEGTQSNILNALTGSGTAPTPEAAKTTADIRSVLPNIAGVTGWEFPSRTGLSCPTWNLDLTGYFGSGQGNFSFTSFCTLANDNLNSISNLMILVWFMVSGLIVMRA